jgi:2-dehydro-3-deoxyglucarate aldolase
MERSNALREAVESDRPAYGVGSETYSPAMVEIHGALGFDFVWLDFEHAGPSPYDSTAFEELTRAAELAGTELLVRLPSGEPSLIRKVLDAGVRTVLIPRIETAAEARRAVEAARFSQDGAIGDRGIGTARTGAWGGDREDHARREDDNTFVGVMIENRTAVENLPEILAVENLGFVFVGPSDLSVSLGRPLETGHPEVQSHIETVEETVRDSDVALGGIYGDAEAATAAVERGYRIVRVGSEVGAVREQLGGVLGELR